MKKSLIAIFVVTLALGFSSCSTMKLPSASGGASSQSQNTGGSSAQDVLGSVLGELIGKAVPLSDKVMVGTWTYDSPECRFESENALSQAGGMAVASEIESKLANAYAKIGIAQGACSFTFNDDKSCEVKLGSRTVNGTWSIDPQNHAISITAGGGIIKLNGKVFYSGSQLSLLFDAKRLLTIAQTVSAFTGKGSASLGALSSAIGSYKGLMLGMNLKK